MLQLSAAAALRPSARSRLGNWCSRRRRRRAGEEGARARARGPSTVEQSTELVESQRRLGRTRDDATHDDGVQVRIVWSHERQDVARELKRRPSAKTGVSRVSREHEHRMTTRYICFLLLT